LAQGHKIRVVASSESDGAGIDTCAATPCPVMPRSSRRINKTTLTEQAIASEEKSLLISQELSGLTDLENENSQTHLLNRDLNKDPTSRPSVIEADFQLDSLSLDGSELMEDPPPQSRKACFVLLLCGLLVAILAGLCARAWPFRQPDHRSRVHAVLRTSKAPPVQESVDPPAQAGVELCDTAAAIPVALPPRAFNMSSAWRKRCQARPNKGSQARWTGRNWCWAAIKGQCLYDSKGHSTWQQAQEIVANQGLAPPVDEVLFTPITSRGLCERLNWAIPGEITPTVSEISEATRWLNEHVYVMVLNLPTATKRWEKISRNLDNLDIEYRRSPAVDMSATGAYEKAKKSGDVPEGFDFEVAQKTAMNKYQGKGGIVGTVGVATAHLRTMRHAIAGAKNHTKSLVLVLEDDVELAADFAARLMRLVQTEVPCDWHALSLKSRCSYGQCVTPHLTRVWPDGNEPADRCRQGVDIGFYAMLYRSEALPYILERMRRRVWDASTPHCLDVDVALASISEQVSYYAVPSFLQPGMLREGHMGSSRWAINEAGTHVARQ